MSKNVNLVSQEGDKFEVSREIAMMSNLVKHVHVVPYTRV